MFFDLQPLSCTVKTPSGGKHRVLPPEPTILHSKNPEWWQAQGASTRANYPAQ